VVDVVQRSRMAHGVIFDSFSPALLALAAAAAPEIPRELSIAAVQFLSEEEVEAATGLPVTVIDKQLSLGLTWAEIGPLYRLPGYASPYEALFAAAMTGSSSIAAELLFLGFAGAPFVAGVHGLGMRVAAYTATNAAEWGFAASLGVDAIYMDDVPLGVSLQP
jgi:hypothetical protein